MRRTGRRDKGPNPKKELKVPHSYKKERFKWSLEKCQWKHKGWHNMSAEVLAVNVINKLQNLETQTWQEIQTASGGKAEGHGSNSHEIPYEQLRSNCPAEYKYYLQKYARDFEKVFSLRLTGQQRLIGYIDRAKFFVIWYDSEHEFF